MMDNEYGSIEKKFSHYYKLNSNQKRILLIGHSCDNGGAEILFKNLIKEFRKQHVEVAVLVKCDGLLREDYEKLAPTFVADTQNKIEYCIKELSNLGYKSAISNTTLCGNFISTLHKYGLYSVNLVHELPGMVKLLNAHEFAKMIFEQSDLVIFPSMYVFQKFEETYKIKSNKIIQPQGLYNDFHNFDIIKSRKKLEKKYNIPQNNKIILNVGRGELRKGFDLFIDISKKLKNDNYSFIWVGSIDEDMKEKYCDDFNDNLIITGFIYDKDELCDYYAACDLFMLTSREDPFPSTILEAFNTEKPVIAFENAGGFQDIVINNKTGFLVEYESTNALIDKIKLICSDIKLKKELGKNAKELAMQYSFKNYVKFLTRLCISGEEIFSLKNNIVLKNENIVDLKNVNNFNNDKITKLKLKNNKLKTKNKTLKSKNKKLKSKNRKLKSKNRKLKSKNRKLKSKNRKLNAKNNEILSSSSWKLTKPLRKIQSVTKIKSESNISVASNSSKISKMKQDIIKQDNIIKKNYSFVYTYPYFYNTYVSVENINRVNLFFDKIDKRIFKLKNLFSYLIRYCNKFNYEFRIIYTIADFKYFNLLLKENNLKLPKNVSFLNLKNDNYLEIGLNEKNVCTSWKTAKRLINTKSLNSPIYFYLDDLNEYLPCESFEISKVCYDNNVVILNDDKDKLEVLKNYYYNHDLNINKKMNAGKKILCCDFGELIIEGIELLNYLFLNNLLDFNKWEVNIISNNEISRFCRNPNKFFNHHYENLEYYDLLLKFDYHNNMELNEDNCLKLFIKKVNDENFNVIDILNNNVDLLDNFIFKNINPKPFFEIDEIFKKINEVD